MPRLQYVKIYCEAQRARDMKPRGKRGGRPPSRNAGACLAQRLSGTWFCCCCGKPVKIVEP